MKKIRVDKIHWICADCGIKVGRKNCELSTWHKDKCDICKKEDYVTEPRDFGGISGTYVYPEAIKEMI